MNDKARVSGSPPVDPSDETLTSPGPTSPPPPAPGAPDEKGHGSDVKIDVEVGVDPDEANRYDGGPIPRRHSKDKSA